MGGNPLKACLLGSASMHSVGRVNHRRHGRGIGVESGGTKAGEWTERGIRGEIPE